MVIAPPFNRWVVFYRVREMIEVVRVLYGTQNWRGEPRRFF
jgi:plasmid stabilization system protein ParE